MKKVGVFVPIVLGLLTAFGPFIIDFYLPAMPEMAESFKTSPSMVALSLTAGLIGLAIGQLLIGPLSDKYGRKRLLIFSMLLFILATVLCIFAPNIHVFNGFRVLQGLGGAGGIVLAKSIATDMFTGTELQKFMAILGAVNGIAPVTAPVIGSTIMLFSPWRGIFVFIMILGITLAVCTCFLKETLGKEKRSVKSVISVYGNLFKVFRNSRFTLSTISMMFCFFTFFAYIASSPFILQKVYRLTSLQFSLCFGLIALSIGIGSALCTLFKHQNTALKCGSIDFMISAVLVAFCLIFQMPLMLLVASYIYMMISFGMIQPTMTSIALDSERSNAGAASAVFGASIFVAGSLSSPLVSMGNIVFSSSIVIVAGALLCLVLTLFLCSLVKAEGMKR
ncbi:MAG: multidrug effflux MFS transporter [Prevotella sp.]|jgi:DHA1 family bicyclomycin/chloramphenicol resistance-like MFS transporter